MHEYQPMPMTTEQFGLFAKLVLGIAAVVALLMLCGCNAGVQSHTVQVGPFGSPEPNNQPYLP
jgi:hypothetical protein